MGVAESKVEVHVKPHKKSRETSASKSRGSEKTQKKDRKPRKKSKRSAPVLMSSNAVPYQDTLEPHANTSLKPYKISLPHTGRPQPSLVSEDDEADDDECGTKRLSSMHVFKRPPRENKSQRHSSTLYGGNPAPFNPTTIILPRSKEDLMPTLTSDDNESNQSGTLFARPPKVTYSKNEKDSPASGLYVSCPEKFDLYCENEVNECTEFERGNNLDGIEGSRVRKAMENKILVDGMRRENNHKHRKRAQQYYENLVLHGQSHENLSNKLAKDDILDFLHSLQVKEDAEYRNHMKNLSKSKSRKKFEQSQYREALDRDENAYPPRTDCEKSVEKEALNQWPPRCREELGQEDFYHLDGLFRERYEKDVPTEGRNRCNDLNGRDNKQKSQKGSSARKHRDHEYEWVHISHGQLGTEAFPPGPGRKCLGSGNVIVLTDGQKHRIKAQHLLY